MIRILAAIGRYLPSDGMLWGAVIAFAWTYCDAWGAATISAFMLTLDYIDRSRDRNDHDRACRLAFERGRQDMIDRLSISRGPE